MPSDDYKRGYSKGYQSGCRRNDANIAEANARAEQAAKRAERAEAQHGVGHCESCAFWKRGGDSLSAHMCAWGECRVPNPCAGTPWGSWARESDARPLITTPRFGCLLFNPRAALRGEG